MRDDDREQFQVNLKGIVEILSHHLYSGPRVYVRELVQNGRDAIAARRLAEPGFLGSLEITAGFEPGRVEFRDDGVGLTADQMRALLATVGATSKRGAFDEARRDFLGQFGIGLLSCFLIADSIEVHSRSRADGPTGPTMTWTGYGDGTFTIAPAGEPLSGPGSRVVLQARHDDAEWATPRRVRRLVDDYARYLDIPITIVTPEGSTTIEPRIKPWDLDPPALSRFANETLHHRALSSFRVSVPVAGVEGVAMITAFESHGGDRTGDIVYSRGMLVADDNTQLAPPWAGFARLVLEAGALAPTASRESLQDSKLLREVRDEIGRQLRAHVESLARRNDIAFSTFIDLHGVALLGMARENDELLRLVQHLYPFETSRGELTLNEVFALGLPIVSAASKETATALGPLIDAQGGVLINTTYVHHGAVLDATARRNNADVHRLDLEQVVDGLPRPAGTDLDLARDAVDAVASVLGSAEYDVEARAFLPTDVPALVLEGRDATRTSADDGDPWASFADFADAGAPGANRKRRLVLNVRSAPVRAIANARDLTVRRHAAESLLVLARLMSGLRLTDEDAGILGGSLGALIALAANGPAAR